MYITTHVHDIVMYIPTNRLLELYPVGMQFDKEHSTGLVWWQQVSRYWDEVW